MKTIRYTLILILLFFTELIMAQPLPPSNPNGSPVPVENALWLLILGIVGFGFRKSNIKTIISNLFKDKFKGV